MAIRMVRGGAVLGLLIVAVLASSISSASAGRPDPPGQKGANHCVNEFDVDYNTLYGVSDQFRTFECRQITTGEYWIPFLPWITDDGVDSVYPPDYVPSEPAPVDDFVSKVVAIKVVVDGGTAREKTQSFAASKAIRTDVNAEELQPGVWPVPSPMASMLPRMRPVSVGEHTFEIFVVLSAEHCDGLGADPELQCLPAGEIPFTGPRPLTITSP